MVKAQLLAFLVYTTPASLQQQLQGMGPEDSTREGEAGQEQGRPSLEEMLPEPCPVLHHLVNFDAGLLLYFDTYAPKSSSLLATSAVTWHTVFC